MISIINSILVKSSSETDKIPYLIFYCRLPLIKYVCFIIYFSYNKYYKKKNQSENCKISIIYKSKMKILLKEWKNRSRQDGNGHENRLLDNKILDVTIWFTIFLITEIGSRLPPYSTNWTNPFCWLLPLTLKYNFKENIVRDN